MLKEEWLAGNGPAIELLIRFFDFDVLDLRLKALPEEVKAVASKCLATLLEMGGDNPDFYQRVVEDVANQALRQKEKERNRQFGLAVQDAIAGYLRERNLDVTVVDRGYDLDVDVPKETPAVDAGSHEFDVGPYHVEVKATTTGEARLTPAQAETASRDDLFVLSVVDLRECPQERLCQPWNAADVEPLARMVTGLRPMVADTRLLVAEAADEEIAIRNAGKLRYAVPPRIWERGISLATWVDQIASHLT